MAVLTKEMIEVMQAFEDGKPIEAASRLLGNERDWKRTLTPKWNWADYDYRVAVTKPSIDWSHVSDQFNAMATEPYGRSWLTETLPANDADHWTGGGIYTPAETFASFTPGACDWQDSLVVRPGYMEDKE